ncbi:MAG: 3-deoxy-manno-octulosonate cytidylyltransferase [Bacteroidota bacterium]|nr:3-deoxy-manno-octulosonate cytidylyltransferase [Bacteroidota bacterium]
MTVSALIPARLNSTRLEKKLIKNLGGIPVIVRTYQNICSTKLFDEVVVVTDSDDIINVLKEFDIKFLKSKEDHNTGTDRIAEFSKKFKSDIIINVQGDEPFVLKDDLSKIINTFKNDIENKINVISLMTKLISVEEINNPNNVKVVVDKNNNSLMFSRSIIPYKRVENNVNYFKHIGIYAFRNSFLNKFKKFKQTNLELTEMIEALRIIEHGYKIHMIEIDHEQISIDTIDDFNKAKSMLNKK